MQLSGKAVLGTFAAVSLGLTLAACGGSTASNDSAGAPSPSDSSAPSDSPGAAASVSPAASSPAAGTPTSSPSNSGSSTSAAGPGRCTTTDLTAKIVDGSPGAGQRYATIMLTNISKAQCTVYGYGGMQLLSSTNQPVPTRMVRIKPAPKTITLAAGGSVTSLLHWTVVPSTGESETGPCEPTADHAVITPPGETHSLRVAWVLSQVCNRGTIDQQPYVASTG